MSQLHLKVVLLAVFIFIFSNCTTTKDSVKDAKNEESVPSLRVGITPNYPPVIFKQGGKLAGIEADMARRLANELGRAVQFVELPWDKQIPALLKRNTDMIMSGMSITKAREIRIKFTDHYLKSGLIAMMRIEDAQTFNSIVNVMNSSSNVGVVAGTTSDEFVRKNFPNIFNIIALQEADDAPPALDRRSIDIFVHDAPSIMWLVSENETDLTALWEPLNEELLAWGVRRDDEELLMQVNSILNKWKSDGTLDQILLRWLPSQYMERFR